MRIWTQKSASIQKRTSPLKFDNFAEKSEKDTVSYLSSKVACVLHHVALILQHPAGRTGAKAVEPEDGALGICVVEAASEISRTGADYA